ncbi:hypothetical protein GCM10009127_22700 [Alteraurantiacibacter aestuarii]
MSIKDAGVEVSRWSLVRLELAPTVGFPKGSPSRFYLLRLPLFRDGAIDIAALLATPRNATVRRFWPNEPDRSGYIIRNDVGWAFSYPFGEVAENDLFEAIQQDIRPGGELRIFERDGSDMLYRIKSVLPEMS